MVLIDPLSTTAGASGAIFGLMGGAVLVARENNVDLMRSGILPTIGLNLLITFSISGVSIGGHLGGLVGGLLAGVILTEGARRLGRRGDLVATGITLGLGLVFAVVAYALMGAQYGLPA